MFTTKILYFLLLVPNKLQNFLSGETDSIYIRFKNRNAGNDARYYTVNNFTSDNDDNMFMLHKIRRHMLNKNIIEELENNDNNIYKKLELIEKYTDLCEAQNKISEFNLLAGNLLNDFYDVM
jgi:hypothetical protein